MSAARRQRIHDAMLRLADGDRAAFDPLFDELWPLLRRFCARTLGDVAQRMRRAPCCRRG